jgi:carbamoyltransferase
MQVRTVLGFSISHDASVCLVRDGRVLAAINEERYNRKKLTCGVPVQALAKIFEITGVSPSEVDFVALAGRETREEQPITNDLTFSDGSVAVSMRIAEWISKLPGGPSLLRNTTFIKMYSAVNAWLTQGKLRRFEKVLRGYGINAPLARYEHHDCHVAAAFYTSGWDECLIISNDGWGDGLCSKVAIGKGSSFNEVANNTFFNSLGQYYNYATHFCGFKKCYHTGKITGLAAHGDPSKTIEYFRRNIPWVESKGRYENRGKLFTKALADVHRAFQGIEPKHVAAGVQRHFEEVAAQMVRHYVRKTGQRKVALVGGVHANVRVNQVIAELPEVEEMYVFPNMGDGGLGLGAAYLGYAASNPETTKPCRLETLYLGSGYSEREIEELLVKEGIKFSRPADITSEIASYLSRGYIVARFSGKMEYGPRALCNRSILYEASQEEVNKWLNTQLQRTEFMPFAPVMRDVDAPEFLKNFDGKTAFTAQFMTTTYYVSRRCQEESPAVVHIDGTARPQVVSPNVNQEMYELLTKYKELTGRSILVNTSFNMHNEPIVCSPQDAISAYRRGNLDVLALGSLLVVNEQSRSDRIR